MSFTDLIPHAPQVGLFVAPHIPESKLENALEDYAKTLSRDEVFALFDATLMGSAKDGAVFARDRMVFQNNDLQPIHNIRYEDIVQVDARRKLIGGRRVLLTVNRGRATFEIEMDFSGKPQAADFVLRFLREAMLRPGGMGAGLDVDTPSDLREPIDAAGTAAPDDEPSREAEATSREDEDAPREAGDARGTHSIHSASRDAAATDAEAVSRALDDLRARGLLSDADYTAMLRVLER